MGDFSFCSRAHGLALSRGESPGFTGMSSDFQGEEPEAGRLVKKPDRAPGEYLAPQARDVTVGSWLWWSYALA